MLFILYTGDNLRHQATFTKALHYFEAPLKT